MSSFADAEVSTRLGHRRLAELCQALETRAAAKPERAVKVAWTETDGTIDFGWARCTIRVTAGALALRAEAEDESALRQVCELITRHLEKPLEAERLTVTWLHDGRPIAGDGTDRRDAMRAFHGRMRDH